MSEHHQWGPWVQHDGGPCPLAVGVFVQAKSSHGTEDEGFVTEYSHGPHSQWIKHTPFVEYIVRYRVRKPRGFEILEQIVQNRRPVERPVGEPA